MTPLPAAAHDAEADTLYVYLQPAIDADEVTTTVAVSLDGARPGALLELDAAGRLVGIEVLHAATTVPNALLDRVRAAPAHGVPLNERHP